MTATDKNERLCELALDMDATLGRWYKAVADMARERRPPTVCDLLDMDQEHARVIEVMGELGIEVAG